MAKMRLTHKGEKYIIETKHENTGSNYNLSVMVSDKTGLLFGWYEKHTITNERLKAQVKAHIDIPRDDLFI